MLLYYFFHFVFCCCCSMINLQNRVYEHKQIIIVPLEPNKLVCVLQINGSWWGRGRHTIQDAIGAARNERKHHLRKHHVIVTGFILRT